MKAGPGVDDAGRDTSRRQPWPRRPRLLDIARDAGVDPSVVSRVLNNKPDLAVRPETRERVIAAAARLNYRPNSAARSLRTAKGASIGLLVPGLYNNAYAEIAAGAEQRALATGYLLAVVTGSLIERISMLASRVDGALIATATRDESMVAAVHEAGIPMLLVNRHEPLLGLPSVTVDDEAGAAMATRHLLSLGHTRIAHIAGPQNTDTARRRLAGFELALSQRGVVPANEWIVEVPYSEAGGYTAAGALLSGRERPTAILASTVPVAIGAMSQIRKLGLEIPRDISIVGYDDVDLAMYLDPPLTTVRMPLREMGSYAVDLLVSLMGGRDVREIVLDISPELVVRASCAPPPDIDTTRDV